MPAETFVAEVRDIALIVHVARVCCECLGFFLCVEVRAKTPGSAAARFQNLVHYFPPTFGNAPTGRRNLAITASNDRVFRCSGVNDSLARTIWRTICSSESAFTELPALRYPYL
jgi:hypothetical protein